MKRRVRRSHRVPRLAVPVCLAAAGVLGSASAAVAQPVSAPQAVTSDAKVNALLKRMTLSEKLTMIEGSAEVHNASDQYQAGYMPGVKKLGIPALELTDGPPGVITRQDSTGMTSTMGVGATFSRSDARANGTVIGRDARDLGQDVALQPFVNMDRDTSWSRGFNTFGEDPLLTGLTGAAEITGIQSQGVMAQVKHFIAYDGGNNVEVNEQALHEIYLQPFTDAVDAGVASIMCSYNIVNGEQSCGNKSNLVGILRNQLHFKGFVTSDWGANHSTLSINGGVDLEMPGGGGPAGVTIPTYFTKQAMTKAIKAGKVSMTTLNGAVGDILYEMDRFGLLSGHSKHTVNAENHKADEKVVLKTARDATTLLKNHADALPLSKKSLSDLALIGPGAGQTIATNSGGEAAGGLLSEQPSALSELKRMADGTSHINYAVGDDLSGTPIPAARLSHGGQPGLLQTDTRTKATSVTPTLDLTTGDKRALPAGTVDTWTGDLTVPSTGDYWINMQALGATAGLTVDGKLITTTGAGFGTAARYGVVHPTDGSAPTATPDGLANNRTLMHLTAGAHTIKVTDSPDVSGRPVQVRLNWVTPQQITANDAAAVAAAKSAKTAVVFAWDTGSGDLSTPLPDGQDKLIEQIAKVNPNTIVVLQSGQPIQLPWIGKVKALVESWYGGDKAGVAAADVLMGKTDPSGRLPMTWPYRLDQEVAHEKSHPGRQSAGVLPSGKLCTAAQSSSDTQCKVTYSEGVDIGYRYFDATHETPRYPFGYGLSYTSFRYRKLDVSRTLNGGLQVSFTVTNTGNRTGQTVPQLYLGAPKSAPRGVQFAPRALAGFTRVRLGAHQSKTMTIGVPLRQLQYWSTKSSSWMTAVGPRVLYLASNERTNQLKSLVTVR